MWASTDHGAGGVAWSGLFNLPAQLWVWWGVDALIVYTISGIAMGWAGGKWAPA